ncbi:MAG: TonB family protein [Opitutaceae bacterium]|nr:TonB family protein [Opitutaceae bacterium]
MSEDSELLRRYIDERADDAFAGLVRRHIDLVYSVALRHVGGDTHLAKDVVQIVFTSLARKATALARRPVLAGWLYRTTQYAAIDAVRTESRRRKREREAHTMNETAAGTDEGNWESLRPLLDRAIGGLDDDDRDAIVLRFFNGRSFAEVGAQLRLNENAARMRVERALAKLHATLARDGVTSTSAALGLVLAQSVSVAAPAGLAASVSGAALAGASSCATTAWMTFMSATKLQFGIAAVIVAAGGVGYVIQADTNAKLRDELVHARISREEAGLLRQEVSRLATTAAEIRSWRENRAELARLRDEAAARTTRTQPSNRSTSLASTSQPAWRADQPVYEISQLEQQPKPKLQPRPEYPAEMRQLAVSGEVRLSFVIDANGDAQDVQAMSATNPAFAESAVAAVRKWKFEAGKKAGTPVNARMEMPIKFIFNPTPVVAPTWF